MTTVMARGPSIGAYRGKEIFEWIADSSGIRYEYNRIANEEEDGGVELSQLRRDECVIAPGLIYRRAAPLPR